MVLRGMVIENAEWVHTPPEARQGGERGGCRGSNLGANAARDAFYIQRRSWKRKVVRRGVRLATQAVRGLAEQAESLPRLVYS